MSLRRPQSPALLASAVALFASSAPAMPGFFAYQGEKPVNRQTHVVLLKKGEATAVTVMADYEGDLRPFALVLPVPGDVKAADVRTLKRDFVDRVDSLGAPRFHEFWEMDPCDGDKREQEWERDLSVQGAGFLGVAIPGAGPGDTPTLKPPKEMSLTVEPDFKVGEQEMTVVAAADAGDIEGWLSKKGWKAPPGANAAVAEHVRAGMGMLVVTVDPKRVELAGSDRAIVSPVRYVTKSPAKVLSKVGLLHAEGKQELFVHVLADQRYDVKGYPMVYPPTNVEVDFKVKERMGEFYAAVHDRMIKKAPLGVVAEYAWSTKGCGQPCATEPLLIHELLSLGADVLEEAVPKEERFPDAPPLTEAEEAVVKEIKDKKKKKELEDMRKEGARRKALVARHVYVLSRLHHRYDASSLPSDLELGPAPAVRGGVDVPEGPTGVLPTDVKPAAENTLQTRYTSFHASPAVIKCDSPQRHRWGKAPRTYRGLRKIWIAQDTGTKNRKSHAA
ncbi:MAG: DUF2330 domain-containing protein, partial [Deltaproteobacteria bacterium]|nr:DUF2330 domain-containing protein [Deltaproteobacteria bacterium]